MKCKTLGAVWMMLLVTSGASLVLAKVNLWPRRERLPVIEELPDPFVFLDGRRVQSAADWASRRREMIAAILHYQYGHLPPPPDEITARELSSETVFDGAAVKKEVLLTLGPGRGIRIHVGLWIPTASGPWPAILKNDEGIFQVPIAREIIRRGYLVADYDRTDLDPDKALVVGPAQSAYPDYDWATLAVWAWGGMRVIDYLLTLDGVDPRRIIFTGHSRGGKTALLAGALDERIALVAPNGSGCGGAGCYRIQGESSEDLEAITRPSRFSYWFVPRLRSFAGHENRLPFDQHFLEALVAPRALLTTDATGDLWANPLGTQQTHRAARPVFAFLGAADRLGMHFRAGGHDQNSEDWRALLDFADKVLLGRDVSRRFDVEPFSQAPQPYSWSAP